MLEELLLEELLKEQDHYTRLEFDNAWLVWNTCFGEWQVYYHKPYARQATKLYAGQSLEEAIRALKEG